MNDNNRPGGFFEEFRHKVLDAWSLQPLLVPLYAIILSFIVGGVLIAIIGVNPFEAYWALIRGMVGSPDRIAASIARAVPLLLIGGITAAWVGTWAFMADTPGIIAVPIILLAGMLGGFVWGGIPGVLRARTGAHEVISTIMLNSIALFAVRWLVNSRDPVILRDLNASVPRTKPIADSAVLPEFVDSEPNLHFGLVVMIALCFLVAFVLNRTTFGFETKTVGTNPHASHYAGIGVNKIIILAMALSGAFAGLAAASEVSGTNQFFQPGTFAFIGFDGIAIALLARANPIAIMPAALLWGALLSGAPLMQQEADVSIDVVRIIQSLVLLFVAADAIVRYLFRIRGDGGHHMDTVTTGWA